MDISKRNQAEMVLNESEEKYRIFFESSKDANYISTIEGIIIDANQSFFDLFGYIGLIPHNVIQGLRLLKTHSQCGASF